MAIEDPRNAFNCDPRFEKICQEINDMRIGDLKVHTPSTVWSDAPEDFAEWLDEDTYDSTYDCITTILSVIDKYLDERSSDDYEFEQADIDELFDYAKNTPVKAFFPSI